MPIQLSAIFKFNRLVPIGLLLVALGVPLVATSGSGLNALSRSLSTNRVLPGDSSSSPSGLGIASGFNGLSQTQLQERMAAIRASGATWVRYDLSWSIVQQQGPTSYDWSASDRITSAARAEGLNVIMAAGLTPPWQRPAGCTQGERCRPTDPQAYITFVSAAVKHYQPYGVHTWEIWNEPNIAFRFAPETEPAMYVEMLKGAYREIKAVDPQSIVIAASTAPAASEHGDLRPDDFLRAMYDLGAQGSFDAIAVHPYTYPLTPAESKPDDAWGQMEEMHQIMDMHGDGSKKIWITELGAPTFGRGGTNDRYITEAKQAQTITEAVEYLKQESWAGPIMWYNWQDTATGVASSENYYGLLRQDGSHKPAYDAFVKAASGK